MTQQLGFCERVVGEGAPSGSVLALGSELRHHVVGFRSLHGQQREGVALVFDRHVEGLGCDLVLNPVPVLGAVARIHHEHVPVGGMAVHEHVVHDAPAAIGQAGVLHLAVYQLGRVVGADPLNQGHRVWALHQKLAHVTDVKHAASGADGFVLGFQTFVLHGHVVSRKGDHFGPGLEVGFVQGGSTQGRGFHAAKVGWWPPVRGGKASPKWTVLPQSPAGPQRLGDTARR